MRLVRVLDPILALTVVVRKNSGHYTDSNRHIPIGGLLEDHSVPDLEFGGHLLALCDYKSAFSERRKAYHTNHADAAPNRPFRRRSTVASSMLPIENSPNDRKRSGAWCRLLMQT